MENPDFCTNPVSARIQKAIVLLSLAAEEMDAVASLPHEDNLQELADAESSLPLLDETFQKVRDSVKRAVVINRRAN